MKAREIYNAALTLINEKNGDGNRDTTVYDTAVYDTAEYEKNAPELINILTALLDETDCHIKNRHYSFYEYSPARIETLDEKIGLHDSLSRAVMPFGLAFLLINEEDPARASFFYQKFEEERQKAEKRFKKAEKREIKNCY